MLSIAKCRDLDYYEREVIDGREDYLSESGTSPGRWSGNLAAADGYTGVADRDELAKAFNGVHPCGATMTARPTTVPGFDLTLSPSKSVSLLWALGSPDDARHVEEALYAAQREVERYLEANACFVRRGHAGAEVLPGKGFLGATFLHRTSRLGDPGIHLHWTVFNVTEGPDGRRTALDARHLYDHRYVAEAVFQAGIRHQLVSRLGVVFDEIDRHGVAEVAGIGPDTRRAFSRRRVEIVAEMDRRGVHTGAGARVATLATRKPKPTAITEAELREEWRQRALDVHFDVVAVPRVARTPALRVSDEELATAVTAEHASFDRRDLVRAVANAARQGATLDQILDRAEAFLLTPLAVEIAPERWSTAEMLGLERSIITIAEKPAAPTLAADRVAVDTALAVRASIRPEQRRMVEQLCLSGNHVDVVIGRAGAGKTFTLDAVRDSFEASGHRVIGATLAARAARQLSNGSGIHTTTAHALQQSLASGRVILRAGDVLVIDEAGMMGTRQLAALITDAHRAEAKVILVGDPKQLPEIEAGGMLRSIADRVGAVELTENHRQIDPEERFVVRALRKGLAELAVRRLDDLGHVTIAPNADALRDQLVLDWWQHRADGRDVVMGATNRSDVRDLNARAHALLEANGDLGPTVLAVDEQTYAIGDRIMTLHNRYDLGVLNGDLATITGSTTDGLLIERDDGLTTRLPFDYVIDHVGHAYARTVHKTQGLTCEISLLLGDDTLFAEIGYTGLTRATHENRLYTVVGAHDLDQEGYPLAHVVRALTTSRAKTAAIDLADGLGTDR